MAAIKWSIIGEYFARSSMSAVSVNESDATLVKLELVYRPDERCESEKCARIIVLI